MRSSPPRFVAALAAALLAGLGLTAVGAAPALAAGPAVSAPTVPSGGGTITVTGSGFSAASPGIYLGVGPAGLAGFYAGSGSLLDGDTIWIGPGNPEVPTGAQRLSPLAADGTFSVTLTIPAATEAVPAYAIYTSKAHGQGMADRSQDTITTLAYAAPEPTATSLTLSSDAASVTAGATVTLTARVAPAAAGSVEFREGTTVLGTGATAAGTGVATFATSALAVGAHAITAAFTPTDGAAFAASTSGQTTVTVTAATTPTDPTTPTQPTGPSIAAPEVPAAGGTVTVTGSGFSAASPGIYLGVGPVGLAGFYAGSGSLLDGDTIWIGPGNPVVDSGAQRMAPLKADGTFSVTLTIPAATTAVPAYAIYTSKAHGQGMADRSQDTVTALAYAATPGTPGENAVATTLAIHVSPTSKAGDPVDVTVTITPQADGTVTLLDNGVIVASGLRLTPDATAPAAAPAVAPALFASAQASAASSASSSVTTRVPALASGAHSFTASFAPDDPSAFAPSTAPVVAHTVQPAVTTPGGTVTPPTQTAAAETAEPVCVARSVSGATLDWGIKSSFRNYISGGIANGSWTLSGVGYDGGRYGWSSGSGSLNTADTRGLVRFPGTVSFSGHGGVLTLTLSNVALRVSGPNTATIVADVHSTDMSGTPSDHRGVAFATVALGGASASGSSFSATGAPASLTADGATAFAGFYTAGTALDPVSFRLPLGAPVACDSSTASVSGLASTGGEGPGDWPLLSGLLILVGVAAVAVVRRRASRAAVEVA